MGKFKDLTGMKFGRLTVIERAENNKHRQVCWKCHCDCGNEKIILSNSLINGATKSCGCISARHRMSDSKIFRNWSDMKKRCLNQNCQDYKDYGGRGISVYEQWRNDFQAFYDYVSKLEHYNEDGYTLDRIDVNGNYEPGNLRWADAKTQSRNRRGRRLIEYKDKTMILAETAELSGIDLKTLWARIKRGDTGDRLFRPVKK